VWRGRTNLGVVTRSENPPPLVVAASLAAVEGLVLLPLAGAQLADLSEGRTTMGWTVAAFFALFGVAVIACAWAVTRGQAWTRGPILLTQLIALGLAWSFRGTQLIALGLVVVAAVVLAGMLHPASLEALADDPMRED